MKRSSWVEWLPSSSFGSFFFGRKDPVGEPDADVSDGHVGGEELC